MTDCLIAGVGGQGTVLASRLISSAALARGLDVRGAETIGMAQRGGSVLSHVRMGRDIKSPLISPGRADVVLAFELCEAARASGYLKRDGLMVACDRVIQPASGYDPDAMRALLEASVPRLLILKSGAIGAACGIRALNTAIIGAACARGAFPFSIGDMEKIIDERFDADGSRMNRAALRLGETLAAAGEDREGRGERHGDD
ncbi:MAG: indolepyruvate oxidoreductase subunit beta [Synergistaceae bacterium]|jgi:indolepyruvate ferredoxin oxidoreductase beta subunit|nr:indolepyruvate oxidoreductase subunit beta [Synergistaceae bacterium]